MPETTMKVDEVLPHPPARVWRALTDPKALATWLMPNDLRPVVAHRFTFWTQPHPEGRGTRLFVEHAGFDPDDPVLQTVRGILGSGWRSGVLASLRDWLTRHAPAA